MQIPVYKGRAINKILFFLCLVLAAVPFAAAIFFFLTDRPEAGKAFLLNAAALGGFVLLYGVLWAVNARWEGAAQRRLEKKFARKTTAEDGSDVFPETFLLPRERLIENARQRYRTILLGMAAVTAVIMLAILLMTNRIGDVPEPRQIIGLAIFGVAILLPGLIIQTVAYHRYARTVPAYIRLHPDRIVIDDEDFSASELQEIRISSDRAFNPSSAAMYRELILVTASGEKCWRIDGRHAKAESGAVYWPEYPQLLAALTGWSARSSVPVTVNYMD